MAALTPKYNIGDTVTLENGTGTVQSITITATGINYGIKTTVTVPQVRIQTIAETAIKA
jgi:small-conductance mechanosensitive channel